MRSENWGGVASLAGSLIFIVAGDVGSLGAMLAFLCAEGILTRFGHKTAGYSAGCALIASGGFALCFSEATAGNAPLKVTIALVAVTWILGAIRYPLEVVGGEKLKRLSVVLQPVVGGLVLVQRIPTLFFAAVGGSYVMLAATCLYALSDVLTGRVHRFVVLLLGKVKDGF